MLVSRQRCLELRFLVAAEGKGMSVCPQAWEVAGFSKRRPRPVLPPSTPPKACCILSPHSTATCERLAEVPAREVVGEGSEREVTCFQQGRDIGRIN